MSNSIYRSSIILTILVGAIIILSAEAAMAQSRGQYTSGFNATNSGTMAPAGWTYANVFQLYSFNQLKDRHGNRLPVDGNVSVIFDHNTIVWTSKGKEGKPHYAFVADVLLSNNSLSSATLGSVAGGGGLTDIYVQPLTVGWNFKRADLQVAYGFVAPTGRYKGGATNNVGTGYWGHDLSTGQTVYLTKDKKTAVSAYEMYEFHGTQRDTKVHPGQTFDVDYSLTRLVVLQKKTMTMLQVGLVGYGQYETTQKSGPTVTPLQASALYRVNALGGTANIIMPMKKAAITFKALKEFGNSSTVQGYTFQVGGAITF